VSIVVKGYVQCKIIGEVTWEMCYYCVGWLSAEVAVAADFEAPEWSPWFLEGPFDPW
jgi:hypothetical protein